MKFTRDNMLWNILLITSVLTGIGGHFDLIQKAFPDVSTMWQSRIELASFLLGLISAYLRMSPLPLNPTSEVARMRDAGPNQSLGVTGAVPEEAKPTPPSPPHV